MKVCATIEEIKAVVREAHSRGITIGLVPTMGYFHEGHVSLMHAARKDCGLVVVSIFVNPIQFGPNEDFERYPRDIERDMEIARNAGVDIIFAPEFGEMYHPNYATYIEVERITDPLCGKSRPGHFKGVATVVTKLFNIVEADKSYFGQKDAQQAIVIQQMVKDLNINTEIIVMPIVREDDGLAMSSRNVYLSDSERKAATILYRSLKEAESLINDGQRDANQLKKLITNRIKTEPLANIDYVEILSVPELKLVDVIYGKVLIALAVRFGNTRLIDNSMVEVS